MAIVNRKVNLILFVRRSGESRHDYVMPIFLVNVDEPYCDNLFRYREGELPLTIYRTLRQSRHTHTHAHTHTRARANVRDSITNRSGELGIHLAAIITPPEVSDIVA